jgi:hypothetical protein
MFMLMDKRASGPFLAEILFIFVFEGKGKHIFQVLKGSNTLKIMTIHFFRVFQRGVSNDCYHVRTVISNHLRRKTKTRE